MLTHRAPLLDRRSFLYAGLLGVSALAAGRLFAQDKKQPTKFQIACMTLPYSQFSLERALTGIKNAGYKYVAWGTSHREDGESKPVPVMPVDAAPEKAKDLGKRCRDMGLEPLMMFSGIYPENKLALDVFKSRIKQAAAGGVPQVLTFGHTEGAGSRKLWIERFKELGPIARDHGVLIVIKQHGGETGTGAACAEIIREVNDDAVKLNYDAGNVLDYLRGEIDPIADFRIGRCADLTRSFCIKDHRNFPKSPKEGQDCGPGFGEIDHYKLLAPVAFTGRNLPLCCENIFAPFVPRPKEPEGVDALAKRAREYLEVVVQGLQS
ncbi:MAG: sugar phosphate isomerase/epimerase [Gemmataceae bacterium]|nr:sugar phosphate isomerase/epimerase [Gemmataceae bacterium]